MYESFEEMMKALDEEDSNRRRFSRKKYIGAGKVSSGGMMLLFSHLGRPSITLLECRRTME